MIVAIIGWQISKKIQSLNKRADFFYSFLHNHWYDGIFCRVADHQDQEGALVGRAAQDHIQEFHGAGSVGQGDQAGMVDGSDQQPGCDAHRFSRIIVLDFPPIGR